MKYRNNTKTALGGSLFLRSATNFQLHIELNEISAGNY